MNRLLSLKLLLIKHGKCSACKDRPHLRRCGVCFNTRLEPEVLEAITAMDLAEKFHEGGKRLFEDISQDDYAKPPRGAISIMSLKRGRDSKNYIQNSLTAGLIWSKKEKSSENWWESCGTKTNSANYR